MRETSTDKSKVCTGRPQALCWEPGRDCPMAGLLLGFLFARGQQEQVAGTDFVIPSGGNLPGGEESCLCLSLQPPAVELLLAQDIPCSSQKALSFPRAESCSVPVREDSACLGLSQWLLCLTVRTQVPMELDCLPKWATLPPNSASHC